MPLDAMVAMVARELHEPLDEAARATLIEQSGAEVNWLAALLIDAVERCG